MRLRSRRSSDLCTTQRDLMLWGLFMPLPPTDKSLEGRCGYSCTFSQWPEGNTQKVAGHCFSLSTRYHVSGLVDFVFAYELAKGKIRWREDSMENQQLEARTVSVSSWMATSH